MGSKKRILLNIRPDAIIYLFLVVSILSVYYQVRFYSFFIFDDIVYVVENYRVKNGITVENIIWAFFSIENSNWHPLTWLSHMLDVELYGINPGLHHITNVYFHIINTLLLYTIFKRMTGSLWRSGFIAILFALHPMHVESVAWIAERKDVLSTFFWMLTIWCYIRYAEQSNIYRYLLVVLFFILGLMSKPMVVTLPFVLILIDYWPLNRLFKKYNMLEGIVDEKKTFNFTLIYEKIPLLLLTIVSSVLTYFAQYKGGAVASFDKISLGCRISNALVSYVLYAYKMIIPIKMAVFYPYPNNIPLWITITSFLILLLISFMVIKLSKHYPYFIVGWLWYLGTLFPVIGFIQIGMQAMADRYTYVPYIGLSMIIYWSASTFLKRNNYSKTIIAALVGAYVITIGSVAWIQTRYWSNSIKLLQHAVEITENNSIAHNNLGSLYAMNNLLDKAIPHFSEAVRINPAYSEAQNNLAKAYTIKGNLKDAILHYKEVVRRYPNNTNALINLALIYMMEEKYELSISFLKRAVRLQPDSSTLFYYIAIAYSRMNKKNESILWLKKAIEKGYDKKLVDKDENFVNIRGIEYFNKIMNNR